MRIAWFLSLSRSAKEVFVGVKERRKHLDQAFSFLHRHFPIREAQKLHEQFRKYTLQELMAICTAWSFSSSQ
jgi:hypothetical protein